MSTSPRVVCGKCRKPLEEQGERDGIVYFQRCPKHPGNSRPGLRGGPSFTIPFRQAAVGSVGIPQSTLDAPRRGPLAI